MKKKLFLGAALALALGAGAVTAAHLSGNGLFGGLAKDNVESLASCEYTIGNLVFYSCSGSSGTCIIYLPDGTLFCSGERVFH